MFVKLVLDFFAFLQRSPSFGNDRRKMDEDIPAYRGIHDKPKSLLLVEPLYYSSRHTLLIIFTRRSKQRHGIYFWTHGGVNRRFAILIVTDDAANFGPTSFSWCCDGQQIGLGNDARGFRIAG